MKIPPDPNLPIVTSPNYRDQLRWQLDRVLKAIASQLNRLSEGSISAHYTAMEAAPTSGSYQQGDAIKNTVPTELGNTGSKYIIESWHCVASGTPGVWVEGRKLTGN